MPEFSRLFTSCANESFFYQIWIWKKKKKNWILVLVVKIDAILHIAFYFESLSSIMIWRFIYQPQSCENHKVQLSEVPRVVL